MSVNDCRRPLAGPAARAGIYNIVDDGPAIKKVRAADRLGTDNGALRSTGSVTSSVDGCNRPVGVQGPTRPASADLRGRA
ncbi:MAG: hypothetical protein QOI06_3059 [Nocardioidaceae bacterium]|jgi:hypothetical protein|nr:hypothetical protein [Nocardioidaceae bacterium]